MTTSPGKSGGMTAAARRLVVAGAFLGWLCAGIQMTTMQLASGAATHEFLSRGHLSSEGQIDWKNLATPPITSPGASIAGAAPPSPEVLKKLNPRWFARYSSIFLFGAAFGGFLFGWLGDRIGRVKAMGGSILCYSLFAGAGYFVATPEQLLVLRFLSGMGMGGMWPPAWHSHRRRGPKSPARPSRAGSVLPRTSGS